MFQQFLSTLKAECHVSEGTDLVVACSGGADSTALLHLLVEAAGPLGLRLHVAHLDHGLRKESRADGEFVAQLARDYGLSCSVERVEVAAVARARRENLEAVGRELRRRFLQRVAADSGSSFIALGHHRGDQAETVLFRMLRGCGTTGLSAMACSDPPYIRPLLSFSRDDLHGYLRGKDLCWREDASNRDLDRTRNKLRHQVLPLLRQLQADADEKLSSLALRCSSDEDFWQQTVTAWVDDHVTQSGDGLSLALEALAGQHVALRKRIWLRLLRCLRPEQEFGEVHLEACEGVLMSVRPQLSIDLPGVWVARRYRQLLLRHEPLENSSAWEIEMPGPGDYLLPDGRRMQLEIVSRPGRLSDSVVEFSAAAVPFPLLLRNRRCGDRFFPQGGPGHRKLKAYFIDARLPREQRDAQALLVSDEILWIAGVRRCQGRDPVSGGNVLRCTLQFEPEKDKTT